MKGRVFMDIQPLESRSQSSTLRLLDTGWHSPVPQKRWEGARRHLRGPEAFLSKENFEKAQLDELESALAEHELKTLGRLLTRGNKLELEVFLRTHGVNPIFNPKDEIDVPVGVAKADVVDLREDPRPEAHRVILNGDIVHVLFQAGEATRFKKGPFYRLNPLTVAKEQGLTAELKAVERAASRLPSDISRFLLETDLGPKQNFMILAALRRVVQTEVNTGRLSAKEAHDRYREAVRRQKIMIFVSPREMVGDIHYHAIREKYQFFGFDPGNIVTIEQELCHGLRVDEEGNVSLIDADWGLDAAGHLYALLQAARPGDFTTYTDSGRPIKPMEVDALAYLLGKGGKYLSIIRINDMDRHTTEIINPKSFSYALQKFSEGYVNVIEGVSNPQGQKGGTGTTFGDPDLHVLTETHENSFPALSRPFEAAMKTYLETNAGRHPAYNAMRQWSDLLVTRTVLREIGGRIVFVPRQSTVDDQEVFYVGVDMPMGDLSLLYKRYPSRMFQFSGPNGRELLIHDMKTVDHLTVALRTLVRQCSDPSITDTIKEMISGKPVPFTKSSIDPEIYGAPTPEFS